ncbi:hypothetical protein EV363DRAFT_1450349 [Boletus edulis]|uniref:Betaine lipid synthase n=1 Tax=Boletus edulis BED1 TaxID=1328754 RepID=A0AAD4C949_BOLED|nr:hypothetical protein EV363DRAFT_1450349 [Boletus edulis]KAF8452224.1 hypothetical protein L210DRAFT_3517741 [Boletus edulis BED1]
MLQILSLRGLLLVAGLLVYINRRYLGDALVYYTGSSTVAACLILAGSVLAVAVALGDALVPRLKFVWHCFIRPLGATDQRTRLDKFYKGQADVYDRTRSNLLRGRNTMLKLSVSHLRTLRAKNPSQRLVWIDIGGGTGHNIELMDKHFPISQFDAVYLIDLCEPLLDVARKRFARKGWGNITVLCQDATEFSLPEWSTTDPKGSVNFITLSYSLSMIPNFYGLLDRIDYVLSPETGLLGVVDFYTSGRQPSLHEKAIGGTSKECGWLSRWFWQIWFDFDHVSLSPHRRDYLEYKFGTVKTYNGRNHFIIPFIVRIPYYIWLGRSRSCDVSRFCHAFEVESGNMIGNCSPASLSVIKDSKSIPLLDIGKPLVEVEQPVPAHSTISITPPLSSFHYHVGNPWRLPYYEQPVHKEFRTFIYSFTWEDPFEDMKHLNLGPDDSMLVITSAGDNALHYAIAAQPRRIHCVDMNPCQGHLLELKLAGLLTLNFDDFFALFGAGQHPQFRELLDSKISPYLSSIAYQFWRINDKAFSNAFYMNGYSGLAIRFAQIIFALTGVTKDTEDICNASTTEEQVKIWKEKLMPVLLNPLVVTFLKSPLFCWNALGVPLNQRKMLLNEGTMYEFLSDTLDPVPSTYLFKDGAYFYPLCLTGHYTPASCPSYLTRAGFDKLRSDNARATDAFRLHTDSIVNVLRGLSTGSLTRAVIMDHLDWFAPGSKDVDDEVTELARVLSPGGFVLWRSAARQPWYQEVFRKHGFVVSPISIRKGAGVALDMVNMYASFWKAVRV